MNTDILIRTAFDEGYDAYREGKSKFANPHDDDKNAPLWEDGWRYAWEEDANEKWYRFTDAS